MAFDASRGMAASRPRAAKRHRAPLLLRTAALLSLAASLCAAALLPPLAWSCSLRSSPRVDVHGYASALRRRRSDLTQRIRRVALAGRGGDYSEEASGWSADEEKAVMDEVLGRPSEDGESADLLTETRLLREQTRMLAEELRLLTEALRSGGVLGGQAGTSAAPAASVAPAVSPPVSEAMPAPAPKPAPVAPPAPMPAPPKAPPPKPQRAASPVTAAPPAAEQMPAAPAQAAAVDDEDAGLPPKQAGSSSVKVVSAGHDDGNTADFFVDDIQIPIRGENHRRGLNVVVIDPERQRVLSAKTYDIWGNPRDENRRFADDIRAVEDDHVVLVAMKDSGGEHLDSSSISALRSLGADIEGRLEVRESYVLIGYKEGDALVERRGMRTLLVDAKLPFNVRAPASPVTPSTVPASGGSTERGYKPYTPPSAPAPAPARTVLPKPPRPPAPASASGAAGGASYAQPPPAATAPAPPPQASASPPEGVFGTQTPPAPSNPAASSAGVSFSDVMADRGEKGQPWDEVADMLQKLQKRIEERKKAMGDK
eukprot:TRINITY_DN9063_c0_g1_i5.p1 TRINITY_DN9063_c0_g1~~TRINITY_DN9063_c0_g1_i5.p1  ORF type:complete len:541 (+),score=115.88 TRINITY_DN9063_c0_g1_i5:77-1699(+)